MSINELAAVDPRYTKRGALYVPAGEGTTKWLVGDTYTFKADSANTNGSLGFIDASVPPGGGSFPHVHYANDEAFHIISGEVEFLDGNEIIQAGAGDFVFIPRGIRHRFTNKGLHTAKVIFFFTPAGPEGFMLEGGDDARPGEPPGPWGEREFKVSPERMLSQYKTEMLPDR
jgi:mannose-6-phosphate isomerase-like protein (cupin superfamily)